MEHTPYTVDDVMTQTVIAVGSNAPFKEIVATMNQWKVSALPVLAGEGRVIGVVSEADLLPKEEFRQAEPGRLESRSLEDARKERALTAQELMSTPALTVHPSATLAQAARIMAHASVKRLPVVDAEGLLQGIVSRADLLKVFLRSDHDIEHEVLHTIVGRLFAASPHDLKVTVFEGVVTLSGHVPDPGLVPVAQTAIRAVEGVVDVVCEVTGKNSGQADPRSAGAQPH